MAIVTVPQQGEEPSGLHCFTVEQYLALDVPDRTELLEGLIYDVSPKNAPHSNVIEKLTEALVPAFLGSDYKVRFEQPIAVHGWTGPNAPEIDVAVVARRPYARPPTAADAVAFIEVSDTTYARDRNVKIPLYVSAGVPSWIVNVALRQVERYSSSSELAMQHGVVLRAGETFDVAGVEVDVSTLFEETTDAQAT